jgi:hypothetical protein
MNKWHIYLEKKRWKRFLENWEASKQSLLEDPSMDSGGRTYWALERLP